MTDSSFRDFILDQLRDMDNVHCRAMFGGYGLYHGGTFFGIIHKERLYFKTTEKTSADYKRMGMKPFKPNAKMTLKNYFEVPPDIIENSDELIAWAKRAITLKPKYVQRRKTQPNRDEIKLPV